MARVVGAENREEEGFGLRDVAEAAKDAVRHDDAVEGLEDCRVTATIAQQTSQRPVRATKVSSEPWLWRAAPFPGGAFTKSM